MKTETITAPLVKETLIKSTPDKVWSALTDPEKVKQWFMDPIGFKPEVGNEFTMTATNKGKEYLHLCEVMEVIPEKKLMYSWKYKDTPGESFVTFELSAEGDKTRLKLTHEGLETFPQDSDDYARKNFDAGWTHFIEKTIKEFVEKE